MFNLWLTVLMLWLALAGISCRRDHDPGNGFPIPSATAAEPNPSLKPAVPPEVEKAIQEKGQILISNAFGTVTSRLGKAIKEVGYTNAIEFCSVHGIPLATSVGVTNQVVIRRVTHRPRNLQNRADSNELAIIRQYLAELSRGGTLKPIVTAKKPEFFTFYAPIVLTNPMCLNCHGQRASDIKPDVLIQIMKSYPADAATEFKQGDLRGIWSVDFKKSDFIPSPR